MPVTKKKKIGLRCGDQNNEFLFTICVSYLRKSFSDLLVKQQQRTTVTIAAT